jgi:hypothetical protein
MKNENNLQTSKDCNRVTSRIEISINMLSILCAHNSEIILLFNMSNILTVISNSELQTLIKVDAYSL